VKLISDIRSHLQETSELAGDEEREERKREREREKERERDR